jgi:beta-galactosidase
MLTLDGPISPKAPYLWHGGDYNPEQWSRDIWTEDFRLMQKAGVTVATVGIFSWSSLQPAEDRFTFDWLDEIMDGLHANGIKAILATPSAAQPAWMSQAYPQMLRSDERGIRKNHGGRANYCPNSSDYRRLSGNIAHALAERYKDHPSLILWHVSNEYAGACFCETCAGCFREWLQRKYGSLDELNHRWWTTFWSHTYTDWSQIMPPLSNGETHTHGLNIDYFRFMTESQLECFCNERDIIRSISPDIPITTNLMGTYKPLDYRRFAQEMDVISFDCYPHAKQSAGEIAFMHDINRGLKDGQPFLLMEQTPSSQNWQWVNALKRPGVLRLWSYLAVAHGADSVLYFQWRRGRGGSEKLHGAIIEHSGRDDTRVFREVSQIGAELKQLGEAIIGARTNARVAILFDWDNWHVAEDAVGPIRDKRYYDTVCRHYLAFYRQNIPVDVVFSDSDFSKYDVLIAPMLYMVKSGMAEKIEALVARGGSFVTTCFSGIVDETDLAFENGYPGPLSRVLGIWVEEIDAMYDGQTNTIEMIDGSSTYSCSRLADLLHAESAEVLATYGSDFYAGMPCLTRNTFGKGHAYYIATDPDDKFLDDFYTGIVQKHALAPMLKAPTGVEVTTRQKNGTSILFLLNHNRHPVTVDLDNRSFHNIMTGEQVGSCLSLDSHGVGILSTLD